MQIFVGGQSELTLVTLMQNSAKITKIRHTEDILGEFGYQASSCIHFWLKTVSSCRKMQIFVGGQNELTLVTLLQNSAKITKNCHTEDILGKFGLQASSCIHFWLKTVSSCRKMQIFVGGQNELTLVTLLQNSAKITKIRHTEDILGKFALQASSCIHFWLKTVNANRCLKTKYTQNVFSVTIFGDFCTIFRRVTKVSSFWPPTKICIFRQELTVFSQKGMQLDA